MRTTVSAELIAAQQASVKTPYFKYVFTSKDGLTEVDYTSRINGAELHYEPYNGYGTILLYNNDHAVVDIKGYWVEPVLGFDATGSGGSADEGPSHPRMWVKNMFDLSSPGVKIKVLELEDAWKQLKERHYYSATYSDGFGGGSPPAHDYWYSETLSYYGIMYIALDLAGMSIADIDTQDDGFINGSFHPLFKVNENAPPYETFQQVIYRCLKRTKSYLRNIQHADGPRFEVRYPQDSDAVDETYYSYQAHWFKEFAYKTKLTIPNHVVVYCNKDLEVDGDGFPVNAETYGQFLDDPPMTGIALEQSEIDKYEECYQFEQAGDIHLPADANFVAEALLDRNKLEAHGGRLVIPHDCRVELYDKVAVYDAR